MHHVFYTGKLLKPKFFLNILFKILDYSYLGCVELYQIFIHPGVSPVSKCAGVKMVDRFHWPHFLSNCICIVLIIITVIGDIRMFLLVRNLRKIQPVQLIPWKSIKNEETKKDITIPVRATSISIVFTILTISTVVIFESFNFDRMFEHWIVYISMQIIKIIGYPSILAFTIKNSKNKKPTPIIPHRPMFHDSELDKGMLKNCY